MSNEPLVVQYTKLLHRCGRANAPAVLQFRKKHAADAVFLRRAAKLDELFALKQSLTAEKQSQ